MSENNVTPAPRQVTVEVGGRPLILETGKIAKQANGAIVARYGDTVVLTTACMAPTANDRDFLPLTVDYRENTYSAGKIPGGFFKREGRPSEKEFAEHRDRGNGRRHCDGGVWRAGSFRGSGGGRAGVWARADQENCGRDQGAVQADQPDEGCCRAAAI